MVLVLLVGCSSRTNRGETTAANKNNTQIDNIEYADNMSKFNELIKGQQPVLVDFYADWCAPCRMMAPILEQVASNMGPEVKIVKVDVDKNQQAAINYGVQSIPTLMLFQNGKVKWQGAGVMQADQIEMIIRSKSTNINF